MIIDIDQNKSVNKELSFPTQTYCNCSITDSFSLSSTHDDTSSIQFDSRYDRHRGG